VSESSYPYESGADYDSRACSPDLESMNKNVSLTATYQLTSEASMATYALGTGPIAVVVDASEWSTYTGGVVSVCGTSIDHAVQVEQPRPLHGLLPLLNYGGRAELREWLARWNIVLIW
jgi:hypothetical protein